MPLKPKLQLKRKDLTQDNLKECKFKSMYQAAKTLGINAKTFIGRSNSQNLPPLYDKNRTQVVVIDYSGQVL
jgi:hypothetical protein